MREEKIDIDQYIDGLDPEAAQIMSRLREMAKSVAPDVKESISYQMPLFSRANNYIFIGAFKSHIGIYPPIKNSPDLIQRLRPFANNKGNLAFKYKNEMPYDLIKEAIIHTLL